MGGLRLTRVRGVPRVGEALGVGELVRSHRVVTASDHVLLPLLMQPTDARLPEARSGHRPDTRALSCRQHQTS